MTAGLVVAPRATRIRRRRLAVAAVSDFLQPAHKAADDADE